MSAIVKRKTKISFRDQLEKRRADLEELNIRTNQVSELRLILAQTIEDERSVFQSDEQKKTPILNVNEREIIKIKMMNLIEKFFK